MSTRDLRGRVWKLTVAGVVAALVATGCSSDDPGPSAGGDGSTQPAASATGASAAQLEAAGLWDDGPCDAASDPLTIGMLATFESPVLTAQDQVFALDAAAKAFNRRGGANGHCVKVVSCDEKAEQNTALECVRTLDKAGVQVMVNDAVASTPGPEVGEAFSKAGIPRFANASTTPDLTNPETFPFDAGGIGTVIVMPQGLVDQDVKKIASVRVDLPAASALVGLFDSIYKADGADFVADTGVAAGTTDYAQFVLGAKNAGAKGVILPLGGQEATQVLRAAQQLNSDLLFSTSLGTLSYADLADLGDFAKQIILNGSNPPATADGPAIKALVADLAASGKEELQAVNLKTSAMHSWIGLYALLDVIRTAKTEDFGRANLMKLIKASGPIDMLGLTSDWTPDTNNPGTFPRTGNGHYEFWRWDPDATYDGKKGNLVKVGDTDFVKLLCGSALGAPAATC